LETGELNAFVKTTITIQNYSYDEVRGRSLQYSLFTPVAASTELNSRLSTLFSRLYIGSHNTRFSLTKRLNSTAQLTDSRTLLSRHIYSENFSRFLGQILMDVKLGLSH
jgi:hypothetical protein